MTTLETPPRETALFDLEGQTTPITRSDPPARLRIVESSAKRSGLTISFVSDTAPGFDVWRLAKHEPLSLGHFRRRDDSFAWKTFLSLVDGFKPVGTPVADVDDFDLVWFETTNEIAFSSMLNHWRTLAFPGPAPAESAESAEDETATTAPSTSATSAAWTAFEKLGSYLNYTDLETSSLLGLGDKTAYGWRRQGHEPQPRLARRLYESYAFVEQLVRAIGLEPARAALSQGGPESALALIRANRVADAEARFADLIYSRRAERPAIGSSRAGDQDLPSPAARPEHLPGGRRRVRTRRGR